MLRIVLASALISICAVSTAAASSGSFDFVSAPGLHPARISVTRRAAGLAAGYIFVAPIPIPSIPQKGRKPPPPKKLAGQAGPLIVDDHGNPIWEHPLPRGIGALNFRSQVYAGAPVLTWFQGTSSSQGVGHGEDEIFDSSYHLIAHVRAGNGLVADLHDFVITPAGTALLTAYKPVRMDLRPYGGPRSGLLYDTVVQEVDIKTHRVVFEWHPLTHVSLRESYTVPVKGMPWDPYHVNAIHIEPNGDLLISARNTWAAYSVSHSTGQINWRLGGKRSTFKLGGGARFAWQHDVTLQPDGTVSIFDNEAAPPVGRLSRGLILSLDLQNRVARIARTYTHPGVLAVSQGNIQLLPNGNVLAGWGASPFISEYSKSGNVLFDAHYPAPDESYRAFREPWVGHPTNPPDIAVKPGSAGKVRVYTSWNGATEVASWQVLSGANSTNLAVVASSPRQGFETAIAAPRQRYFAVRALNSGGQVLATSGVVKG
ncbi:MAG: hypothetical protein NVS2B6_11250 [Thermoleophilaceae bacterium]